MYLLSYYDRGRSGTSSNKSFGTRQQAEDYAREHGLTGGVFEMKEVRLGGVIDLTAYEPVDFSAPPGNAQEHP